MTPGDPKFPDPATPYDMWFRRVHRFTETQRRGGQPIGTIVVGSEILVIFRAPTAATRRVAED